MNITIIRADVSHAAAIATIGKKSFHETFSQFFKSKAELFKYLEETYDSIKIARSLRKESNVYFIALLDEVPVGFVKIKLNSLNDQIESISQMELQKIYVLPEYHSFGAGKALLNEVMRLANKTQPDYLWLDVHTSNSKAIEFYEKNSFKKAGHHYFTIGTQTMEYYLLSMPVNVTEKNTVLNF